MLVARLKSKLLTRMSLTQHAHVTSKYKFPTFFPDVKTNWVFRLDENAFAEFWIGPGSTKWTFENAFERWKMWKTQGFEHFSFNMAEKSWRQLQGGESADSLVFECLLQFNPQRILQNEVYLSLSPFNGHFRNLTWRYLPDIRPIFQA